LCFLEIFFLLDGGWLGPRLATSCLKAVSAFTRSAVTAPCKPHCHYLLVISWLQDHGSHGAVPAPTVAVGSASALKVSAVREAFPGWMVTGVDVPSGVRPQPVGKAETLAGARNRARAALSAVADAVRSWHWPSAQQCVEQYSATVWSCRPPPHPEPPHSADANGCSTHMAWRSSLGARRPLAASRHTQPWWHHHRCCD
jgi:hypothetical protein